MGRSSKNYSERELKQGRVFQCILYPDSDSYNCQELLDEEMTQFSAKYRKAKFDIIPYKLPLKENFERNLIVLN